MRQTLSLFLLLCLLVGQACADERVTLRLADQKGNMRAQLEAAGALDDLTYDIRWFEFPAAAPSPKRSMPVRWMPASSATRHCSSPWPPVPG